MYHYTTNDFNGVPDISKLHLAISSVLPDLDGVVLDEDNIAIMFNTSLSQNDLNILDNLVATHDNTPIIPKNNYTNVPLKKTEVSSKTYTVVATFRYVKSQTINYIEVVSNMDTNATSYSVRLYDKTNDNVMAETTCTNIESEIIDLGTISNHPQNTAILEVQMKVNYTVTKKAYIDVITMYNNN